MESVSLGLRITIGVVLIGVELIQSDSFRLKLFKRTWLGWRIMLGGFDSFVTESKS